MQNRIKTGFLATLLLLSLTAVGAHAGSHGDSGSAATTSTGPGLLSSTGTLVSAAGILVAITVVLYLMKESGHLAEIHERISQ